MYASVIFYTLAALNGIMASPVQEAEVEPRAIGPRAPSLGDIPFPAMPVRNHNSNAMGKCLRILKHAKLTWTPGPSGSDCGTNTQTNACSAGSPYCCSSDGNGGK